MRDPSTAPAARTGAARTGTAALEVLEPRVLFAAGQLDPAFGNGGRLDVQFPGGQALTVVRDSLVQTDGKIVLSGETTDTDPASGPNATDFAVARLNPDGSPDTTFSGDGIVVFHDVGNTEVATGVAIQSDGKIVASGLFSNENEEGTPEYAFYGVLRFNPDGTPDTTWGVGGVVVTVFGPDVESPLDSASDVVVGADGRITAIGGTTSPTTGESQIALARYTPEAGALDPTFGTGGRVITRIQREAEVGVAATFQADGRLLVTGAAFDLPTADSTSFNGTFLTARFNADGSVDETFGDGGAAYSDFTRGRAPVQLAAADAITIQPDGRIIVGGLVAREGATSSVRVALARLNADGSADTSFGKAGLVESNLGLFTSVNQIMTDEQGRIVCSGLAAADADAAINSEFSALVIQYGADGKLDKTFGDGGRVIVDPTDAAAAAPARLARDDAPSGLQLTAAFGAFGDAPLRGTAQVDGTGQGFQDVLRRQAAVLVAVRDRILVIAAANEQLSAARLIGNGADLAAGPVGVRARPVAPGGKGSANVRVANNGNEPVPGSTTVLLLLSTDQTFDPADRTAASLNLVNNLNPRRKKVLKFRFLYPTDLPQGQYFLLAVADPGAADVVATNNVAASTAQVTATGPG